MSIRVGIVRSFAALGDPGLPLVSSSNLPSYSTIGWDLRCRPGPLIGWREPFGV